MSPINSPTNFRVLQWCKLKNKAYRDKQKLFIVEGYHLVTEAYKAGCLSEVISTEKNSNFSIPSYYVTYNIMEKISSLATPTKILGICNQIKERGYGDSILLIDQIQNPGNLGTIMRSAVAFNVDTIVLHNCADVYNQKVVQSTQGMLFHLNIIKKPILDMIPELKEKSFQIIGTDVKDGASLHNVRTSKKRAVLVGNESEGVSEELLSMCDIKVNIRMNERCESLNVGVATSIILYGLTVN